VSAVTAIGVVTYDAPARRTIAPRASICGSPMASATLLTGVRQTSTPVKCASHSSRVRVRLLRQSLGIA
jgi:hypothetical protein